ncbi:TolC family protein [Thermovibrio sp.]
MNKLLNTALLILILTFTAGAGAITLKEAKELAVKNYPLLKALSQQVKEAELEGERAKRERLGSAELFGSLTDFNRTYILTPLSGLPSPKSPPPFDKNKLTYGVSVEIPLYLGGEISRKVELSKVKRAFLKSALRGKEWQVKLNASTLFLTACALKEKEKALKAYEESLKTLYENAKAGVKAGKLAPVDLLKVEYRLKEAQYLLKKTENQKEALKTALSEITGVKVKEVELPKVNYKPLNLNLNELKEELLKRNDTLKSYREEVKLANVKKNLSLSRFKPKLLLKGSYERNYGFNSGKNEPVGSISLTFSLPVFNGGRRTITKLIGEREKRGSYYRFKTKEKELITELSKVVSNIKSYQEEITSAKAKLKLAKEVEKVEELKYLCGKGDVNHLLLAKSQRFLSQAELTSTYYLWLSQVEALRALLEVKDEQ